MNDKCIINVSTGTYIKGLDRLRDSLDTVGFDGDLLGWTQENQIGAPLHKDNPYAFKCYAFDEALRQGYRKILWVDASIWAVKPLDPIWNGLKEHGYVKQYAGHLCGTWSSDEQLEYFGVTRDEAMKLEMYGNGGFLALDFDIPIAVEFFKQWKEAMLNGMFKGSWNNDNNCVSSDPRCKGTRHDMICGSLIANKLEMYAYPEHCLMTYVGDGYNDPPETAVLYAQGL
ncbi:hypothetical protein LCGC14_0388580 [marine sediment metagenome]|uniref:Uncharacterized protein n=1 Tax=marine sediment metagenome TaxID=412755 RepID=A0A0F9VMD5_9ZZZZ